VDDGDRDRIDEAIDVLVKTSIYIDDASISMPEIKNKARRLKAEVGLDLIVVDYLQLITADSRAESRHQEITVISRTLKQLAKEMDCPVIALSQLSRALEKRTNKQPILSDLRESGAIEQDADLVVFLYRESDPDKDEGDPDECEIIIAKHRNGATGKFYLSWIPMYTKFANKTSREIENDF
jgi:replicative DNA helicase